MKFTKYTVLATNNEVILVTFDREQAEAMVENTAYSISEETVECNRRILPPVDTVYAYLYREDGEVFADYGTRKDALAAKRAGLAYQIEAVDWGHSTWSRFLHDGFYVDYTGVHHYPKLPAVEDLPF